MRVADAVVLVAAEDYDHHVRVTHTDTDPPEVTDSYFFKGNGDVQGWILAETPTRATFLTMENPYLDVIKRFVASMNFMDEIGMPGTVEILKGDV